MPGRSEVSARPAGPAVRRLGVVLAALLLLAGLGPGSLAAGAERALVLDFTPPADAGGLPPGWEALTFRRVPRATRYRVVPEGDGYVLRAESEKAASGLYRRLDLDPRIYRTLTWRWKVENILEGADARRKDGDDYPARVYVAFRYDPATATLWERTAYGALKLFYGDYPPRHVINYIWDNRLPTGAVVDNAYTDRAKMIVVESGAGRVGRWVAEERDLYADYRRLFGGEPPRIAGVAVMTDTDDTGERAVAYYGALTLRAAD
jgi:hypothetical protein